MRSQKIETVMKSSFPRMHVSLYVSDINRTIVFYNSFFGKKADKVEKGYAKYVLSVPALVISFIENTERVQSNFGHLGFQVETRKIMESHLNKARALGIVTKEEMGTSCCYALQDKFWVNDPDGIQWEIYYFHDDVAFNDPRFAENNAEACCMPAPDLIVEEKINSKTPNTISISCEPGSGCC